MGLLSYCFGWRKLDIRPGELVLEVGSGHKPMIRSDVLCDKFLADATERCGDIWWWPALASRRTGHMGPCGWANGVPSSGLTHPRTWPLGLRERSPERGTASLFAGAPRRSRLRRWLPGCTTNIWGFAAGGDRGANAFGDQRQGQWPFTTETQGTWRTAASRAIQGAVARDSRQRYAA